MKKRLLCLAAALILAGAVLVRVTAPPETSPGDPPAAGTAASYGEKLERIGWHAGSGLDTFPREEALSYEEAAGYLSERGFTGEEVLRLLGEDPARTEEGTAYRWGFFQMDRFVYEDGASVRACLPVELAYTGENLLPDRIAAVGNPEMLSPGYLYDGTVFCRLVSGREIYYSFTGALYDPGTAGRTLGGTAELGAAAVTGTLESGGWLQNVSDAGTYYSTRLEK